MPKGLQVVRHVEWRTPENGLVGKDIGQSLAKKQYWLHFSMLQMRRMRP